MSNVQSRIVNVIETTQDDEKIYFTLEGLMIGGFKGGIRQTPEVVEITPEKPKGGVITAPTPHEVQRKKDKDIQNMQTPDGRLKNLKENIA